MTIGPVRNIVQGAIVMSTPVDSMGRDTPEGTVFPLLPPEVQGGRSEGRRLHLVADRLDGLAERAGVFYRGIRVGEVVARRIGADGLSAIATLTIDEDYTGLVSSGSRFWIRRAVDAEFSLFGGARVKVGSVAEILKGGVEFTTPPREIGAGFRPGAVFRLSAVPTEETGADDGHSFNR